MNIVTLPTGHVFLKDSVKAVSDLTYQLSGSYMHDVFVLYGVGFAVPITMNNRQINPTIAEWAPLPESENIRQECIAKLFTDT